MMLRTLERLLLASALSVASAHIMPRSGSQDIQWKPCNVTGQTAPMQCAKLPVPLDYTSHNSSETLDLDLIRARATKQPSDGSILFNFGGPGGDGQKNLATMASRLLEMTGGQHDLVSWDPRATGNTLPYQCYTGVVDVTTAQSQLFQVVPSSNNRALERLWADGKALANRCGNRMKDAGELVGTVFTARDAMRIVDALDEDGLLRYWGFSYGSMLGATIAAMFPDRMDRVILDAVQNPTDYWAGYDFGMFADTDKVFRAFLEECVKSSPQQCELARGNATASQLEEAWESLLDHLRQQPMTLGSTVYDVGTVISAVMGMLYYPSQYKDLAKFLAASFAVMQGQDVSHEQAPKVGAAVAGNDAADAEAGLLFGPLSGIRGSDKAPRASDPSELVPALEKLRGISKWFGESYATVMSICRQWPFQAKEQYTGDFRNIKTLNPIMLIGNTYDPVTPLSSARNVSSGFVDSVVLHHDGFGHMSWVQPSKCTIGHVANFFVNGTLPKAGTICQPDDPVFEMKS